MSLSIGAAAAIAGGIGAAANSADTFFNWGINSWLNQQQQEMALERMQAEQEFNASQAALGRDFSASEAQRQRDWEEYMSSSSYQRAIADMKAAGVNPAMIAGGSGASTPQGASANVSSASSRATGIGGSNLNASHIGSAFSNIVSSAINGMIAKDRDAADYMADEIRDNAKHAHRIEEIRESLQMKHANRLIENRENKLNKSINDESLEDYKKLLGHRNYR